LAFPELFDSILNNWIVILDLRKFVKGARIDSMIPQSYPEPSRRIVQSMASFSAVSKAEVGWSYSFSISVALLGNL